MTRRLSTPPILPTGTVAALSRSLPVALGPAFDAPPAEDPDVAERRRVLADVRKVSELAERLLARIDREPSVEARWRFEKTRHRTEAHARRLMRRAAELGASEVDVGRAVRDGVMDAERRTVRRG